MVSNDMHSVALRGNQRASHLVASSQMSGADESQRPTGTSPSSYNSAEHADRAGAVSAAAAPASADVTRACGSH